MLLFGVAIKLLSLRIHLPHFCCFKGFQYNGLKKFGLITVLLECANDKGGAYQRAVCFNSFIAPSEIGDPLIDSLIRDMLSSLRAAPMKGRN